MLQSVKTKEALLALLGINSSRIVSGTIVADHVYVPRCMECRDVTRNPMEIRLLASEFIKASYPIVNKRKEIGNIYPPSTFMMTEEKKPIVLNHQVDDHQNYDQLLQKKNLILLVRKSESWGSRKWHDSQVKRLIIELTHYFPDHNILTHSSDSILHPDFCYACEIIEMANADILMGKFHHIFTTISYCLILMFIRNAWSWT